MTVRLTLPALLLLLLPTLANAQSFSLRGRFQDAATQAPVPGVQVKVVNPADTSDTRCVTAKDDGSFVVTGLHAIAYRLEATRLGYATLKTTVRVTRPDQDAGVLGLTSQALLLPGVDVNESPAPAAVHQDTTEFRAGAVKIEKDATAEQLVQKLPGVTLENGQVKAQGEAVQQVLVNGRPFMGSDPTAAMRNLPAEVVDRIQVYDRQSDQAEFSGFDDGQSQKTMNFILRNQNARFGRVSAGGGDRDRYQAGGNLTLLKGQTRLTLIGMSNNVNQMNFSPQDLFGAMTGGGGGGGGGPRMMMFGGGRGGFRPGGGGGPQVIRMGGGGGGFDPSSFFVGQQPGLTTTNSGGTNYVAQWGRRLQVTASVFANGMDNADRQVIAREYLPPQDSLAFYDQAATSSTRTGNQRFDARLEWTPDSLNSVIVQPRLYLQGSDARTAGSAANLSVLGLPMSAVSSRTTDLVDGNNMSLRTTLRHRFAKRGRNISADLNARHALRDGSGSQSSFTDSWDTTGVVRDTLDQHSTSHTITDSYSARLAYTEALSARVQVQAIWNPSVSRSTADSRTDALDPLTGTYVLPVTALTNAYATRTVQQNGGLAAQVTQGPWKLLLNTSYQRTWLRSERTWPVAGETERMFDDVLPSAQLNGNFANRRNVRLSWNTSTTVPSVGQLQDVVNNANPLSLSSGNPDLRPTYNHSLSLRVSEADPRHSRSKFLFANVTRTERTIGNATFTALRDTVVDGVALARGVQFTRPENLLESWNANLFGVYSVPTPWLKSIVSLNGGGSLNRTPSRTNGITGMGSTYSIRSGAVFASNISENLDFTLSYMGTYNMRRGTQRTASTGDYFSHLASLRFSATAFHGIVVRQELTHDLQGGVAASGQNAVMWNTTLGKKFLRNDRAELRVTATDVLSQERGVNRSITETYLQDQRDRVLGRYVMAVLQYAFR
jgi:hypothetical protein